MQINIESKAVIILDSILFTSRQEFFYILVKFELS